MRPQTCSPASTHALFFVQPDFFRGLFPGKRSAGQMLRTVIALTLTLLLAPSLLAQAHYQGQSEPVPQSGYGQGDVQQPQPYGQQAYPQQPPPEQNYPEQSYPQQSYPAPGPPASGQNDQQQGYAPRQPLSAPDLEQLVAPIALYPARWWRRFWQLRLIPRRWLMPTAGGARKATQLPIKSPLEPTACRGTRV